jgi:hypothetical protein
MGRIQQPLPYNTYNLRMNDFRWRPRINDCNSLRLPPGNCPERLLHSGEERTALPLKAILVRLCTVCGNLVSPACPLDTVIDVAVHQYRQIRPQPTANHLVKLQNRVAAELSPAT